MSAHFCPIIHTVPHAPSLSTTSSLSATRPPSASPSSSSSSALASCQSSACFGPPTPTCSPVPFSGSPTPSYTPCCTPRRLSLSLSLAESSTNLRDSTKTTSTSLGLVRLLLENGISASVYDPRSWDRGLDASGASTPAGGAQVRRSAGVPEETEHRRLVKRPDTLLLRAPTPPDSPRSKAAAAFTTDHLLFQFSPSADDPPFYDTFLASKPARTILREVLGEAEREQTDDDGQTEKLNLRLVDKLKRFRTLSSRAGPGAPGSTLIAPFGTSALGNSALGGGLPGLRRNRSYPAMVGASMAMKDPGGPPSTEMVIPHASQTPQTQQTVRTSHTPASHPPQTRHELETAHLVEQRRSRPRDGLWCLTSNDQHSDDDDDDEMGT